MKIRIYGRIVFDVEKIRGIMKIKIGMKIRIIGSAVSEPRSVRETASCPLPCLRS